MILSLSSVELGIGKDPKALCSNSVKMVFKAFERGRYRSVSSVFSQLIGVINSHVNLYNQAQPLTIP